MMNFGILLSSLTDAMAWHGMAWLLVLPMLIFVVDWHSILEHLLMLSIVAEKYGMVEWRQQLGRGGTIHRSFPARKRTVRELGWAGHYGLNLAGGASHLSFLT